MEKTRRLLFNLEIMNTLAAFITLFLLTSTSFRILNAQDDSLTGSFLSGMFTNHISMGSQNK